MKMQKKLLSVAVAGAIASFAGVSSAALVQNGAGGSAKGHMLIVPYFTVQNGNATLINLVNTDTANGKAVKVRFRGGRDSDDIFDFQVFMSPGDVWTAAVTKGADGRAVLTTTDNTCTLPGKANLSGQSFVTSRLSAADATDGVGTREGYVEIFNMADIPVPQAGVGPHTVSYAAMTADQKAATLYGTIKHNSSGVAACSSTILEAIEAKGTTALGMAAGALDTKGWKNNSLGLAYTDTGGATDQAEVEAYAELEPPKGGLMGNWTIINVPNTTVYTGDAVAIAATLATRVVYSSQTSTAVAAVPSLVSAVTATGAGAGVDEFPNIKSTFDGVLLTTGFSTAEYDFPDMSTPYERATLDAAAATGNAAGRQAQALSAAIAHNSLINEYMLSSDISAKTDWLVSMPTRRYMVAGRGTAGQGVDDTVAAGTYKTTVTLADNATDNNVVSAVNDITLTADALAALDTKTGALSYFAAVTQYAKDGRSSCVSIGNYSQYDREELTQTTSNVVISPSTVTSVALCGEVNVLSLNGLTGNTGALGANLVVAGLSIPYANGWGSVSLNATGHTVGLPSVGYSFMKAYNPSVSAGVSGNFGGAWGHRW